MSQRFSLFYAGFTSAAPAMFFDQNKILDSCSDNKKIVEPILFWQNKLKDYKYENDSLLVTAISLAKYFKYTEVESDVTVENYFSWLTKYNAFFEDRFPPTRIEFYYFVYAQKIATILNSINTSQLIIDLKLNKVIQNNDDLKLDVYLNEIDFAIYKILAPSTLLSSEPRQNYFKIYRHELNSRFDNLKTTSWDTHSNVELTKLRKDLEEFSYLTTNGFKKCILLLKKLGI